MNELGNVRDDLNNYWQHDRYQEAWKEHHDKTVKAYLTFSLLFTLSKPYRWLFRVGMMLIGAAGFGALVGIVEYALNPFRVGLGVLLMIVMLGMAINVGLIALVLSPIGVPLLVGLWISRIRYMRLYRTYPVSQ